MSVNRNSETPFLRMWCRHDQTLLVEGLSTFSSLSLLPLRVHHNIHPFLFSLSLCGLRVTVCVSAESHTDVCDEARIQWPNTYRGIGNTTIALISVSGAFFFERIRIFATTVYLKTKLREAPVHCLLIYHVLSSATRDLRQMWLVPAPWQLVADLWWVTPIWRPSGIRNSWQTNVMIITEHLMTAYGILLVSFFFHR